MVDAGVCETPARARLLSLRLSKRKPHIYAALLRHNGVVCATAPTIR